jgi:hypothetical protein
MIVEGDRHVVEDRLELDVIEVLEFLGSREDDGVAFERVGAVHQLGVEAKQGLEQALAVVRLSGDLQDGGREQDDGLFDTRNDVASPTVLELDDPGGFVEVVVLDPASQKV